jgi:hypothetical protein
MDFVPMIMRVCRAMSVIMRGVGMNMKSAARNSLTFRSGEVQMDLVTQSQCGHGVVEDGFWNAQIAECTDGHVAADS